MRSPPKTALAFAVVASAVSLVFLLRGEGSGLTAESLAGARARWKEKGPKSYEFTVVVDGVAQRVRVRGGEVVEMTTGGSPVPPHVWKYWTVEGMLTFLDDEWRRACEQNRGAVLRAAFEPELGYPRYFLRHVPGETRSTEWRVTEFHAR